MALVIYPMLRPRRLHTPRSIYYHIPHLLYHRTRCPSYRTYHRDRNLYNRVMGLGPDMDRYAVGMNEARHWHRRAYGGLVNKLNIYLQW